MSLLFGWLVENKTQDLSLRLKHRPHHLSICTLFVPHLYYSVVRRNTAQA
jgi:hypothetical protein